jgi:hypothetical protein
MLETEKEIRELLMKYDLEIVDHWEIKNIYGPTFYATFELYNKQYCVSGKVHVGGFKSYVMSEDGKMPFAQGFEIKNIDKELKKLVGIGKYTN